MKKVILNLDSMYVINQPKRKILSAIVIDASELDNPLSNEIHEGLDKISEMSDIVFVFPEIAQKKIDCEKFTNLYSGCAWIIGEWNETLFTVLEYASEIFNTHVGYVILDLKDVPSYPTNTVFNITISDSKSIIFKIDRKTPEELFSYYKVIREVPDKKIWEMWRRPDKSLPRNNFYTLWGTESKFIYLRPQHIGKLLELREISNTFDNYRDFFSSATKNLELTHLDRNIEDIVYETERSK